MRLAVSNIALSPFDHQGELALLPALGLAGLEVAPSRVWRDTWQGLKPADVAAYRRQVEAAGLMVVGLHSLFYDHPDLGLFKGTETDARTMDFLAHLSGVCRDLGGRTLIYGGGRKRGKIALEDAFARAIDFFARLCQRVESDGTCFCFEPLGPNDSDFVNSVHDSIRIVEAVGHLALRVQLDVKALVANDEMRPEAFEAAGPYLAHVHANEPDLGVLGRSGAIDHAAIGRHLRAIGYGGYVSIEQKMIDGKAPLEAVEISAHVLRRHYG